VNEAPTRSGEIKQLGRDKLTHAIPQWLPGEKEILFVGREPGTIRAPIYAQDLIGGPARSNTPEGASSYCRISPDGKRLAIARGADRRTAIFPRDGGEPKSVRDSNPARLPAAWSSGGRFLNCARLGDVPVNI
jgi:Tol biopolymer transport system component